MKNLTGTDCGLESYQAGGPSRVPVGSATDLVGVVRRRGGSAVMYPLALFPLPPTILEGSSDKPNSTTMKTTISLSTPAEVETESLVAVVLDHANSASTEHASTKEKDKKPQLKVATADAAVQAVAADLLASGEVAGKPFETNLMHKPAALKAKRLLLVSGGSAKKFSSYDLRRIAGTAVRALKSRGIRSFAFVAPSGIPAEEAVRAIVEGAHVGNFDPDYYRSDRKDQKIDALTVVASGDKAALEKAANEAQIIGESQNFTRDLVNEPSNRMTPTILGERAKKMSRRSRLEVRSLRRRQNQRIEDGRILERGPGLRRTARADRHAL